MNVIFQEDTYNKHDAGFLSFYISLLIETFFNPFHSSIFVASASIESLQNASKPYGLNIIWRATSRIIHIELTCRSFLKIINDFYFLMNGILFS
jgi:hypothetical protein